MKFQPSVRVAVEGPLPRDFALSRAALARAAAYFASRSSRRCRRRFAGVTVILQHDADSDAVHRAVMGVDGATDVITQRYDAMPGEEEGVWGELYVNVDQARRVAPHRPGWSKERELELYVAHGMDHLSGADDHAPADYARMRRRELKWMGDLHEICEHT